MFAEWVTKGKPSVLGAISGAVAGLVAITPASGFVLPGPALIIGLVAGVVCFWSATSMKHLLGYDDSLDAFGVHGVGGIVGALLTGVFAYGPLSGTTDHPDGVYIGGIDAAEGAGLSRWLATVVYSAVASFILLKIVDLVIGLRVTSPTRRWKGSTSSCMVSRSAEAFWPLTGPKAWKGSGMPEPFLLTSRC